MKSHALPGIFGILFAVCLHASPAHAILQTFVSGGGDDNNTCTRQFPCRSFQVAHDHVNASGGFINCLDVFDSSTNATFNITKSITIDCSGIFAKVLGPGGNGTTIVINGAGIVVTLRGLSIEGAGGGGIGIDIQNADTVRVEGCKIFGFPSSPGVGIKFSPTARTTLLVNDCVISDNRTGILIDPTATGFATVNLQRVTMQRNSSTGLTATGVGGGPILVSVRNSIASQNGLHGFAAVTLAGDSGVLMSIEGSEASYNVTSGVLVNGPTSVAISHSTIIGNGTGVNQFNGGTVFSYGNNLFFVNSADGVPAVASLK